MKKAKTVDRLVRNIPEPLYKKIKRMALDEDGAGVYVQDMIVTLLKESVEARKKRTSR